MQQIAAELPQAGRRGLTIEAAIDVRVEASKQVQPRAKWTGWEKIVRNRLKKSADGALSSGQAVMMSITGHIVRLQAVTDSGLLVDDPYGRVKLKAGAGRSWDAKNKATSESKVGEDVTWPWSQVEPHTFHWVAAISR